MHYHYIKPADASTDVEVYPTFEWEPTSDLENTLEISSTADFATADILSEVWTGGSYSLSFDLDESTTYYWRVVNLNDCGTSDSEIFSFTTVFDSSYR